MGCGNWKVSILRHPKHLNCIDNTRRSYTLIGHREEISSAVYNYDASMIATGSMVLCL